MTRTKDNYPQNTMAHVKALIASRDALALSYAEGSQGVAAADGVTPFIDTLLAGLPQGSLTKARYVEDGPYAGSIAFTIKDRNERFIEPEGFMLLRVLALFETGANFIDKSSTDETKRRDYPEVFHRLGVTVPRLLADAQDGEVARRERKGDHHDLRATNFRVTRGQRNATRGRQEVRAAAMAAYDRNAKEWGLSDHLSREEYQRLIEDSFRLYDSKHAHNHLSILRSEGNRHPAAYPGGPGPLASPQASPHARAEG